MNKGRLEAFSDGVFAIIITIMVLEMKAPATDSAATATSLMPLIPTFVSYLLSFIFVGIYWVNHHHLFMASRKVNGSVLWANLHLLFWLSLFPFTTSWVGQTHFAPVPVGFYGVALLLAAASWDILRRTLIRHHGEQSLLGVSVGRGVKEWTSTGLSTLGIAAAFLLPGHLSSGESGLFDRATYGSLAAFVLYCGVSAMWLVPDRRIERVVSHEN
ncbi:MAG: TMEM175 family protein [Phycisphaerales bacterium]|jgi:uncharacterized membrane protein